MINFFINGCLIVKKNIKFEGNSFLYEMRFLIETIEKCDIKIVFKDTVGNEKIYIDSINGLKVLKINCTEFMDSYNWEYKQYRKIKYTVYCDKKKIYGSFPIIGPNYHDSLKFICVSNNDNINHKLNKNSLWRDIVDQKPDIILHLGDQINSNNLTETTYQDYQTLYRLTYSEKHQNRAMRNALNIFIINSNEIHSDFGIVDGIFTKHQEIYKDNYLNGMKAYLNYQHLLCNDVNINKIITGKEELFYSIDLGKYKIIAIDINNEIYHKNEAFSDKFFSWLHNTMDNSKSEHYIILSPKTVGNINKMNALLTSLVYEYDKNELFHPEHFNKTLTLLEILNSYKGTKILASGGVNKTYINSIYSKEPKRLIIQQLVTSGVTGCTVNSLPWYLKLKHWLQNKTTYYNMIDIEIGKRKRESLNQNFGIIENDEVNNYFIMKNNKCLPFC